jgi:hypothetical protein
MAEVDESGEGVASPEPSARVVSEWTRQIVAEYVSSALTQQLGHWLTIIGASPDLIRAARTIADDELVHAELATEVVRAAGAVPAPALAREQMELPRALDEPLELAIARACLTSFCLGETTAVPLFGAMRDGCRVPVARAFFDRVLRDEVRHRDFGWLLLDWLLVTPQADAVREAIARDLADRHRAHYRRYVPAVTRNRLLTDAEIAWGLLSDEDYARVMDRAGPRELVPRFAERGFALDVGAVR